MITIRKSKERGHANHGWLDSYHTFSFANYFDRQWMGFRDLRVINQDKIAPAMGFGEHAHEDMEIITYVTEGELQHRDSMGTGSVLKPDCVQRMSAGTGVTHSEFNHSQKSVLQLLQIWIMPEKKNIKPSYEEKYFQPGEKKNQLKLIVSREGAGGSVKINQDAAIYASLLDEGRTVDYTLQAGRGAWIQIVKGAITINGQTLAEGDGAAIENEKALEITATKNAEFLLFDLN